MEGLTALHALDVRPNQHTMSDRVPCKQCGATILPATAAATGGVCMACKQGIRSNLERSKEYYRKQRLPNPERDYWGALVNRIYHTDVGFDGISATERVYYLGCVLNGEVYNGGLHQFYSNSSGEHYSETLDVELPQKSGHCKVSPIDFSLG